MPFEIIIPFAILFFIIGFKKGINELKSKKSLNDKTSI